MKKIILIGAGGHAKSTIEIINKLNKFIIIGLIDKKKLVVFMIFEFSEMINILKKLIKKKIYIF